MSTERAIQTTRCACSSAWEGGDERGRGRKEKGGNQIALALFRGSPNRNSRSVPWLFPYTWTL